MNSIPISTAATPAISEMAERKLRESPYYFLRWLTCQFERGVLTLRGRVPNRRLREFAEQIVLRVEGIQSVNNQVEVCEPSAWARSA